MTEQTTGWHSRAIHNAHNARAKRNKEIARLRRERVYDEWTAAELLAIQRDLRASFYARQNTKEQS